MTRQSPDAVAKAFVSAINARDAGAALALWADGALFLPIDAGPILGREAIGHVLSGLTGSGTRLEIESSITYEVGAIAVRSGRMKLIATSGDDKDVELPTNFVTVYRHGAHGWEILIDAPAGFPAARSD